MTDARWTLASGAAMRAIDALESQLLDGTPLPEDVVPCGLYCGCTTCIIREALQAAYLVLEKPQN